MSRTLPLVSFALALAQPAASTPPGPDLVTSGPAQFRVSLSLDRDAYEVGEPIVATVQLVNVSDKPLLVPVSTETTGRHDGYTLEVTTSAGRALEDPHNEFITLVHSIGSQVLVDFGATYRRELMLNHFVQVLGPGRYSVKVTVRWWFPLKDTRAESDHVSFQVVPTAAAGRATRVAALVQRLRQGEDQLETVRLLGFTGHPDAIAPLVTLLHSPDDRTAVPAAEALLYLDHGQVKEALLRSLRHDDPRDRLIDVLVAKLRAGRAELVPLLLPWLSSPAELSRAAALQGLSMSNLEGKDPKLFATFVAMLEDPSERVRLRAANAVGGYADGAAFRALQKVVKDPDPTVSEQATIAVGWVAQSAEPGSSLREEAVTLLRSMTHSGGRPAEQAEYWLARVGAK